MKFYGTFGQNHTHDIGLRKKMIMRNFYVIIYAEEEREAAILMRNQFGLMYSNIYNNTTFDRSFFPSGCIMILGKKSLIDEFDEKLGVIYEQRKYNREIEDSGDNKHELLSKE